MLLDTASNMLTVNRLHRDMTTASVYDGNTEYSGSNCLSHLQLYYLVISQQDETLWDLSVPSTYVLWFYVLKGALDFSPFLIRSSLASSPNRPQNQIPQIVVIRLGWGWGWGWGGGWYWLQWKRAKESDLLSVDPCQPRKGPRRKKAESQAAREDGHSDSCW